MFTGRHFQARIAMFGLAVLIVISGCMRSLTKDRADVDSDSPSITWHESFEVAMAESASSGKPILADFTGTDWCVWCTRLKSDVFERPEFVEWANNNVVLLELDYPRHGNQPAEIKQQNAELAERFQIDSYPTVLFLSPDGSVLGKTGYVKGGPKAWIEVANSFVK